MAILVSSYSLLLRGVLLHDPSQRPIQRGLLWQDQSQNYCSGVFRQTHTLSQVTAALTSLSCILPMLLLIDVSVAGVPCSVPKLRWSEEVYHYLLWRWLLRPGLPGIWQGNRECVR